MVIGSEDEGERPKLSVSLALESIASQAIVGGAFSVPDATLTLKRLYIVLAMSGGRRVIALPVSNDAT